MEWVESIMTVCRMDVILRVIIYSTRFMTGDIKSNN